MIRMMYWATWVQVTDSMPPSTEQKSTPIRPTKYADVVVDADEAGDDEPTPVTWAVRYGERADDRADHADDARGVAAVARGQKVGDRVGAELAEVGAQETRRAAGSRPSSP